jgi:hypothetical protein
MLSQNQYETPGRLLTPLPGSVARRHPLFIYAHSAGETEHIARFLYPSEIPQATLF